MRREGKQCVLPAAAADPVVLLRAECPSFRPLLSNSGSLRSWEKEQLFRSPNYLQGLVSLYWLAMLLLLCPDSHPSPPCPFLCLLCLLVPFSLGIPKLLILVSAVRGLRVFQFHVLCQLQAVSRDTQALWSPKIVRSSTSSPSDLQIRSCAGFEATRGTKAFCGPASTCE